MSENEIQRGVIAGLNGAVNVLSAAVNRIHEAAKANGSISLAEVEALITGK